MENGDRESGGGLLIAHGSSPRGCVGEGCCCAAALGTWRTKLMASSLQGNRSYLQGMPIAGESPFAPLELAWACSCSWFTVESSISSSRCHSLEMPGAEQASVLWKSPPSLSSAWSCECWHGAPARPSQASEPDPVVFYFCKSLWGVLAIWTLCTASR